MAREEEGERWRKREGARKPLAVISLRLCLSVYLFFGLPERDGGGGDEESGAINNAVRGELNEGHSSFACLLYTEINGAR